MTLGRHQKHVPFVGNASARNVKPFIMAGVAGAVIAGQETVYDDRQFDETPAPPAGLTAHRYAQRLFGTKEN